MILSVRTVFLFLAFASFSSSSSSLNNEHDNRKCFGRIGHCLLFGQTDSVAGVSSQLSTVVAKVVNYTANRLLLFRVVLHSKSS